MHSVHPGLGVLLLYFTKLSPPNTPKPLRDNIWDLRPKNTGKFQQWLAPLQLNTRGRRLLKFWFEINIGPIFCTFEPAIGHSENIWCSIAYVLALSVSFAIVTVWDSCTKMRSICCCSASFGCVGMARVVSSALVDRSGSHAVEQTKVVMCYMEGGQGWDRLSWQPPLPKNCPSQVFFTTGPERKRTIGNAKVKLIRERPGSHSCHHHLLWNVWNKAVKSKYLGTRIVHSNFRDGKPFKAKWGNWYSISPTSTTPTAETFWGLRKLASLIRNVCPLRRVGGNVVDKTWVETSANNFTNISTGKCGESSQQTHLWVVLGLLFSGFAVHTDTDSTFCFHEGSGRVVAVPLRKVDSERRNVSCRKCGVRNGDPETWRQTAAKKTSWGCNMWRCGTFWIGPLWTPPIHKTWVRHPPPKTWTLQQFSRGLLMQLKNRISTKILLFFPYFRMFLEKSVLFSPFSDILKIYF